MAFPNVSDLIATTIEYRSPEIADNVKKNNAVLMQMSMKDRIKKFSGGTKILQPLSFAENGNAGWYSGYDLLPVAAQDVISASEFVIKQLACAVTVSGLELLQNTGKEQILDLVEARMDVAESTMANLTAVALYSDGLGFGGKQLDGLLAAVPVGPVVTVPTPIATGTYGNILRAGFPFWQPQGLNSATSIATITAAVLFKDMNNMWAALTRGADRPDLILVDNLFWGAYIGMLQAQQRFTNPTTGKLGFPALQFIDAEVVLDGGIGGGMATRSAVFLNSKYIHYRPHARRNMVAINPKRYAINQDAETQLLGFAGNMTCSGNKFQGRITYAA